MPLLRARTSKDQRPRQNTPLSSQATQENDTGDLESINGEHAGVAVICPTYSGSLIVSSTNLAAEFFDRNALDTLLDINTSRPEFQGLQEHYLQEIAPFLKAKHGLQDQARRWFRINASIGTIVTVATICYLLPRSGWRQNADVAAVLLPRHDKSKTEDHMTGDHRGATFEMFECLLGDEECTGSGRRHPTVYHGVLFRLQFPKAFKHQVGASHASRIYTSLRSGFSLLIRSIKFHNSIDNFFLR